MKQCPTDIWRDESSKTDVSVNQITVLIWTRLIFYSQARLPHQLIMVMDLIDMCLIPPDLIICFAVSCVYLHRWGADSKHGRDCKLSDSHQVRLMTCFNGAWPLFWLSSIQDSFFFFLRCHRLVSLCLPICIGKLECIWFARSLRFCSRLGAATQGW